MLTDPEIVRSCFTGMRVLVVEDNYLVAMLFVDSLEELGCEVIGPWPTVSRALESIARDPFDVAIVDFHLDGETASPVAERLSALGRPFAIASGGGREIEGHSQQTNLNKPFSIRDLERVLRHLIADSVSNC